MQSFSLVIATLLTVTFILPSAIPIAVISGILYMALAYVYAKVNLQLKRTESVTRSPIFELVSSTIHGAATIRVSTLNH